MHFNIWYHVGSKNEPRGQSGFAHLFEHLMFQGSENFNDDFFKATRQIGATSQNGTTSTDRTNYFQTVPKEALDTILWLESDRMGHFLGALTQARLDEQRGVVQNEKRQGQNQPYAIAQDLIIRATYPEEHPYGHSVIGSMDDLQAASLEQVREWFRTYYGPSNAVLVLAGDITPDEARARVERYFGAFNPGTPVAHPEGLGRQAQRAPSARSPTIACRRRGSSKIWNIPEYGNRDATLLDMFADVLAADRTARLTKRLVYDEQIATSVNVVAGASEIAGRFTVTVTGKPGADMARIERVVDEEMARLMAERPDRVGAGEGPRRATSRAWCAAWSRSATRRRSSRRPRRISGRRTPGSARSSFSARRRRPDVSAAARTLADRRLVQPHHPAVRLRVAGPGRRPQGDAASRARRDHRRPLPADPARRRCRTG